MKKFEIFFPILSKINMNTYIFPTHGFGEIFPVNSYNSQHMGKANPHSKEKIWENANLRKVRVS